jgi:hypothetical protein
MNMRVLSPAVTKRGKSIPIASRERSLEDQIWGFVDTSKVNADLFIENLKAEITKSHRPKDFVVVRKEAPGFALTAEQIGLLESCSFVVFCFGD